MRVILNTRNLRRNLLLLLLALVSTVYYLQQSSVQTRKPSASMTMLTISPIVPEFPVEQPVAEPASKVIQIQRNQTFSELMEEHGFDPETIHNIYESAKKSYNLAQIHVGKNIIINTTRESEFSSLTYSIDPLKTLVISNLDGTISAEIHERNVETQVEELGGYIEDSLYSTINSLGEEDQLVLNFAEIFEWDVDFFTELQEGDSFRIVFEKEYVEGKSLGYGRILAAELINQGKAYTALGFQNGRNWEFFSPDGKAMRRAFLASPLKFSRISSGFTSRRYHPILKRYRPHYGIDYVAPYGTPVRTIGSGTVILAGWAGGAGKTVKVQHNREIATVYGHLSRFAGGIRAGARVTQGQVIGYLGSTGLSTGPHLDFRYIKNGTYVNFLSVKSPQATPLSNAEVARFKEATAGMFQKLAEVRLLPPRSLLASLSLTALQLSEEVR